jgi:hypothetical protein
MFKLNSEKIWKIQKKGKLNSEKIWKIQKKIVKWYEKYGIKVGWIVKRHGKHGKSASLSFHFSTYLSFIISMTFALINLPFFYIILFQVYFPKLFALCYFPFTNVILFQVYTFLSNLRRASWIVKRYGKYRRKLWNDMKNTE